MDLNRLLKLMADKSGSDLFITCGVAPSMKVNGSIITVTNENLLPEMARELVLSVMN